VHCQVESVNKVDSLLTSLAAQTESTPHFFQAGHSQGKLVDKKCAIKTRIPCQPSLLIICVHYFVLYWL
jgi:hypothetical protein